MAKRHRWVYHWYFFPVAGYCCERCGVMRYLDCESNKSTYGRWDSEENPSRKCPPCVAKGDSK